MLAFVCLVVVVVVVVAGVVVVVVVVQPTIAPTHTTKTSGISFFIAALYQIGCPLSRCACVTSDRRLPIRRWTDSPRRTAFRLQQPIVDIA